MAKRKHVCLSASDIPALLTAFDIMDCASHVMPEVAEVLPYLNLIRAKIQSRSKSLNKDETLVISLAVKLAVDTSAGRIPDVASALSSELKQRLKFDFFKLNSILSRLS